MATLIALLIALAVYTATVYAINDLTSVEGADRLLDIERAFNTAAVQYGLNNGVPEPVHMLVGGLALIVPAIIIFWVVKIIVK